MTDNLPIPRGEHPPAPANVIYAFPLTGPPPTSIADASRYVQRVLDIVARFGDELQAATLAPYPCAVCGTNLAGWTLAAARAHFLAHPFKVRRAIVGWVKAVMPS